MSNYHDYPNYLFAQGFADIPESTEEVEDRTNRDHLAIQQGYIHHHRYSEDRVFETTEEAENRRNRNFLAAYLHNSDYLFAKQQFPPVLLHQFLKQRIPDRELFNRKEKKKGFLRHKRADFDFNEALQYKALVWYKKRSKRWLRVHKHHTSTERRNAFQRLHNKRINYIWTHWRGTEIPKELVDQWSLGYTF